MAYMQFSITCIYFTSYFSIVVMLASCNFQFLTCLPVHPKKYLSSSLRPNDLAYPKQGNNTKYL